MTGKFVRSALVLIALAAGFSALGGATACGGSGGSGSSGSSGGDTCTGDGKQCLAVGSCSKGMGHITSLGSCDAAYLVCCVPETACPSEDTLTCCQGDAQFRPNCDNGMLVCAAGMTVCP
jgi:hypothetical protein